MRENGKSSRAFGKRVVGAVAVTACLAALMGPPIGLCAGSSSAASGFGPGVTTSQAQTPGPVVGPAVGPAVTATTGGSAEETASTWSYDEDCQSCHPTQAASFADDADGAGDAKGTTDATEADAAAKGASAASATAEAGVSDATESAGTRDSEESLAATHAGLGFTCATCHTDEAALKTAHANATPELAAKRATKLRKTTIDVDVCLSCHGLLESLAEKIAGLTLLTDFEGTTVNPHDLPVNSDHETIDCSGCHKVHEVTPAEKAAPDLCLNCHHASVYACHTCHD